MLAKDCWRTISTCRNDCGKTPLTLASGAGRRHDDTIVMSAELELAAWDLLGRKLWTTYVEPPWEYSVSGSTLNLDVMGVKSHFNMIAGPNTKGT